MATGSQAAISDIVCVRCGYSLRGMQAEGNCPECGLGIARSLALGRQLRESRPTWIASLARGAWLLLASGALLLLGPFARPIWWMVADLMGLGPNHYLRYVYEEFAGVSVFVLAAMANLAGSWLLTRRENPHAVVEPLRGRYVTLRVCSFGPLLASLLWLFGDLSHAWWSSWNRPSLWELAHEMEHWGNWIMCVYALCPMLQFYLLRRLAARVLNRRLLEHTNIVGVGFPAGVILLLVAVPVLSDWQWSYRILNSVVGYVVTLLVWVFIGLFGLWSMYAFGMSARAFGQAAREARAEWEKADAALELK
ncbi:MAG: hypothetical protein ABSH20_09845 [Tepidisphaeraceae bacterium]|jgi:hypothetical protein